MPNLIKLRKGQLWRIGKEGGRVLSGTVWVTVPGQIDDLILKEGAFLPCCHSEMLLEALSDEVALSANPLSSDECVSLGA